MFAADSGTANTACLLPASLKVRLGRQVDRSPRSCLAAHHALSKGTGRALTVTVSFVMEMLSRSISARSLVMFTTLA